MACYVRSRVRGARDREFESCGNPPFCRCQFQMRSLIHGQLGLTIYWWNKVDQYRWCVRMLKLVRENKTHTSYLASLYYWFGVAYIMFFVLFVCLYVCWCDRVIDWLIVCLVVWLYLFCFVWFLFFPLYNTTSCFVYFWCLVLMMCGFKLQFMCVKCFDLLIRR